MLTYRHVRVADIFQRALMWPGPLPYSAPLTTREQQDKSFVCGECGRGYSHQKSLIKHQKYECGMEPQFQCPYCPHRSKLKSNLNQHMRSKHVSPAIADTL